MKLTQLIESFVISNDEFEDYLNRATEQLVSELESGKNPRDAVHDLSLSFADQHNKSYDAYQRMQDSLSARMHTLGLSGSTSTELSPAGMHTMPDGTTMADGPEMMTDPMGDMEMELPTDDQSPDEGDMEDYAAVMDNKPEEFTEGVQSGPDAKPGMKIMKMLDDEVMIGTITDVSPTGITVEFKDGTTDTYEEGYYDWSYDNDGNPNKKVPFVTYESVNEDSDDEKARKRALAMADEPERGEERKKVSLKKAPWEESVNEENNVPDLASAVKSHLDQGYEETDNIEGYIEYMLEHSISEMVRASLEGEDMKATDSLADWISAETAEIAESDDDFEDSKEEVFTYMMNKISDNAEDWTPNSNESINEAAVQGIDALRDIVAEKQAKSIKFEDGSMKVDMFTASAIVAIYDKVNDKNREKMDRFLTKKSGLMKLADFAMGELKEGRLEEVNPLVGVIGGVAAKAKQAIGGDAGMSKIGAKIGKTADKVGNAADKIGNVAGKVAGGINAVNKVGAKVGNALGMGGSSYGGRRESVGEEAEDTTEYGIVRYPDTAISYIKKTDNGWEHIFDKSYGFKGPVKKDDMKHASRIKREKLPSRLLEVLPLLPLIGMAARAVGGAVAKKVGSKVAGAAANVATRAAGGAAVNKMSNRNNVAESKADTIMQKALKKVAKNSK